MQRTKVVLTWELLKLTAMLTRKRKAMQHHYSKQHGIIMLMYTLLHESNVTFTAKKGDGTIPLSQAAENGRADVCSVLLENNRNVKVKLENYKMTLLKAAQTGYVEWSWSCNTIIRNGAAYQC